LPLPPEVDDLNFANLLDRQLRDQVRERMRSAWRIGLLAAQEEVQAQMEQVRAMLPASLVPYATVQHIGRLGALSGGLVAAHLAFVSPRFRALLRNSFHVGRDLAFLAAALVAVATAYRELHSSMPEGAGAAGSGAAAARRSRSPPSARRDGSAEAVSVLPAGASMLPSLATFSRVHALSPSSHPSTVVRGAHEFAMLVRWLRLRFAASAPLRNSTLVLALWFLWLGRRSAAAESFRAFLVDRLRRVLNFRTG